MITDALGPSGKRKSEPKHVWGSSSSGEAAKKPEPPLDGPSLRRLIVAGLTKATAPAPAPSTETDFDDIIADYIPRAQTPPAAAAPAPAVAPEDELAGLI
jgi:hypothetical protein